MGEASLTKGHSSSADSKARNGQGRRANNSNKRFSINLKRELLDMNDEIFLNEQIQVVAIFKAGHHPCKPIKFKRANGREVDITEIGLRHPTTAGRRMLHMFDVTDGGADYRLEFDSERLTWLLTLEADRV